MIGGVTSLIWGPPPPCKQALKDKFNNYTQNVQWALYENLIYYRTQQ